MMFTRPALVAAGFFLTANAHLFISSPSPIVGTAIKDPLSPDGSNFPCHGVSLPGSSGQPMAVGASQNLIFDVGTVPGEINGTYVGGANTAVHGGGSCQLSVTYETDAEKVKQASAWKVIYSIEGGCPTNSLLNLDSNYTGPLGMYSNSIHCDDEHANGFDCVNSFDFSIPEGVKNGQATLAWTWFNAVGNRETYMNCVAIDITGGSDTSDMAQFPDIFLANLGSLTDDKNTTEKQYVKFPDPGKYTTTKTATTTYTSDGAVVTIASATSYSLAIPSAFLSSGGSSGYAPTSYSAPASSTAVPSSYAASTTLATLSGTASAASATGYSPDSASNGNSTSGTCTDGSVSCSSPGGVVCIGDSQFGICNIDYCAVPQALAAGTNCTDGVVAKRDVVRRRSSRLQRHVAGHVHKHHF